MVCVCVCVCGGGAVVLFCELLLQNKALAQYPEGAYSNYAEEQLMLWDRGGDAGGDVGKVSQNGCTNTNFRTRLGAGRSYGGCP